MNATTTHPTQGSPPPAVSAMTDSAAATAIQGAAKALQLPTIRDEAIAIAAAATKARLTHQSFLAHVLLAECDDRDSRRRIPLCQHGVMHRESPDQCLEGGEGVP